MRDWLSMRAGQAGWGDVLPSLIPLRVQRATCCARAPNLAAGLSDFDVRQNNCISRADESRTYAIAAFKHLFQRHVSAVYDA